MLANMDGFALFKKLGAGAKFNVKRFQNDAQRLKIVRPQTTNEEEKSSLDFFNEKKNESPMKRKGEDPEFPPKKRKGEESEDDDEDSSGDESESEASDSDDSVEDERNEEEESEEEELTLLGKMKSKDAKRAKELKTKKKKKASKETTTVKQDELNHFRKVNRIHVQGSDIPEPIRSFDALEQQGIHSVVLKNLNSIGFTGPTPIQQQAIPLMMQRRELLACAPTGSGKTAAFVIPIIHHLKEPRKLGFRALVVAPTRELATQTYRVFCQLADGTGLRIHFIEKASTAAKKFGPQSSQKFDVLVTTPNRLVYMLQQEPPVISLKNIQWFVVDESDKLFEEGKRGFRDQLAAIYQACDGQHVRRAMFSATFAYDVEQWCKMNLDNVAHVYIGEKNAATETVNQELTFVGDESGKMHAIRQIIQKGLNPPVLIFVQSKDRAKELFQEMIYDGINVDVIHSDKTQLQRDNVVKGFRSGRIWVLICTELMGRGIDFKGVNLVINYDFPNSAISYIHRIGRTGRAGRPGKAITFFTEMDVVNLRSIANVMKMSGCNVPEYMLRLKALNKNDRRKMAKSVPSRKAISTVPKDELKAKKERLKVKRLNAQKSKKSSTAKPNAPSSSTPRNPTASKPKSGGVQTAANRGGQGNTNKKIPKKFAHKNGQGKTMKSKQKKKKGQKVQS